MEKNWFRRIMSRKIDTKQCDIHVVVQQSGLLFCDCYIKYPRGKGDCYKCGLSERP
jgi:hypothetical protein